MQLSWNNVAKRISELVRQGRYLTPEEITRYEQRQQEKASAADVQTINAEAGTVVDRTIDDPEPHVSDQYRPITQDDIDEALHAWNGDPASKSNNPMLCRMRWRHFHKSSGNFCWSMC